MSDYNNIIEEILKSIHLMTDRKTAAAEIDKTVVAEITSELDSTTNEYEITYKGVSYKAYSTKGDKFLTGEQVIVLIPAGNFSNKKVILTRAAAIAEDNVPVNGFTDDDLSELNARLELIERNIITKNSVFYNTSDNPPVADSETDTWFISNKDNMAMVSVELKNIVSITMSTGESNTKIGSTVTYNSNIITVSNNSGISIGDYVLGNSIDSFTYVEQINGNNITVTNIPLLDSGSSTEDITFIASDSIAIQFANSSDIADVSAGSTYISIINSLYPIAADGSFIVFSKNGATLTVKTQHSPNSLFSSNLFEDGVTKIFLWKPVLDAAKYYFKTNYANIIRYSDGTNASYSQNNLEVSLYDSANNLYSATLNLYIDGTFDSPSVTGSSISRTISTGAQVVRIDALDSNNKVIASISIPITYIPKFISDWDGSKTVVGVNTILTPQLFAGTKSTNSITGFSIGKDAISNFNGTASLSAGIVGYNNNNKTFELDTSGNLNIGPTFSITSSSITGNGTTATATFTAQSSVQFPADSYIIITGATPSGYNGTWKVTASSTSSVSWLSTVSTAATVQGLITKANLSYSASTGLLNIPAANVSGLLTAATIDAGNITTGTLSASRISSNSISTNKLSVVNPNLVSDVDSFEQMNGLEPYGTKSNLTTCIVTDEEAYHGKYSLKTVTSGTNSYKYLADQKLKNDNVNGWIKLNVGKKYVFSAYVKTTSLTNVNVYLVLHVREGKTSTNIAGFPTSLSISSSNGWTRIYGVTTAVTGTNPYGAFYVRTYESGVTTYWDSIQIEELSTSNDVSPVFPSQFSSGGQGIIIADNIASGTIDASVITVNNLNADKITSGTLLIKGIAGSNAAISVASGTSERLRIDSSGILGKTSDGTQTFLLDTSGKLTIGKAGGNQLIYDPAANGGTGLLTVPAATVTGDLTIGGGTSPTSAIIGKNGTDTTFSLDNSGNLVIGKTTGSKLTYTSTNSALSLENSSLLFKDSFGSTKISIDAANGIIGKDNNYIQTFNISPSGSISMGDSFSINTISITVNTSTQIATATFTNQSSIRFPVGSWVVVKNATPSTYNGSWKVVAATSSSVSWYSRETSNATVQGTISKDSLSYSNGLLLVPAQNINGTLTIGGLNNVNGKIEVLNSNGLVDTTFDTSGIFMTGSFGVSPNDVVTNLSITNYNPSANSFASMDINDIIYNGSLGDRTEYDTHIEGGIVSLAMRGYTGGTQSGEMITKLTTSYLQFISGNNYAMLDANGIQVQNSTAGTSFLVDSGNIDISGNITQGGTVVSRFASIRIPASASLNSYTTAGMYYCSLSTDAVTITNNPFSTGASSSMTAFSLLVERHSGCKQTLTFYDPSDYRTWVRNYYSFGNTWGPWKQIVNADGTPTVQIADGLYLFPSATAGTTQVSSTIVYPTNRFLGAVPKVTVSVATTTPNTQIASVASVGTSGFVIYFYNGTGVSRNVHWRASNIG